MRSVKKPYQLLTNKSVVRLVSGLSRHVLHLHTKRYLFKPSFTVSAAPATKALCALLAVSVPLTATIAVTSSPIYETYLNFSVSSTGLIFDNAVIA